MLVKRIAACTHLYSTFPSNSIRKFKSSHLSTFCTFRPPLGTPLGQSRLMLHVWKEDSMLVKCIAALYPSIYKYL